MIHLIEPDWPAPTHIRACCTTRMGGVSQGYFSSFNLATHVEDERLHVEQNRSILKLQLKLNDEPAWLNQTHSTFAVNLDKEISRDADAAITSTPGCVAVVLTADCLPVLFTDLEGSVVAVAHAGWRGLLNGVIEATIGKINRPPQQLLCWLGPAISQKNFEVGEEVKQAFADQQIDSQKHFLPGRKGHFQADLYELARDRLKQQQITRIYGGDYCSYGHESLFFSYRRSKKCGRMASMIWIDLT